MPVTRQAEQPISRRCRKPAARRGLGHLTSYLTLCLTLSWSCSAAAANTPAGAADKQADDAAVPGGTYFWRLPDGAEQVKFNGTDILVYAGHAVAGIPISQAAGPAELTYRLAGAQRTHSFDIIAKAYTEQHITLQNQDLVTPPEATLARISEEAGRQRSLYRQYAPLLDLSGGFIKPLEGITTSLYGHRRFFNGQPRNPHSGLDIAAAQGTEIKAAAPARVTLADDLYFNGNTLFLDHGGGLITMYCHMSKLLVQEGDTVQRGQAIGLVGATGRATGPHLHWSVSLNGTRVDPLTFMQGFNTIVSAAGE